MKNKQYIILAIITSLTIVNLQAQNPIIKGLYTADPTARVFDGKVYVYPSHDIANQGKGRENWFCMEDYHVFSSENIDDWNDHGVIVTQNKVPWVRPDSYAMWAPDCISKNGKYYFYFPAPAKDTITYGRGFTIGVAIADKPEGPFVPEQKPITGVKGIDPNVFIDKDGQAYLYWSARKFYVAKLKENMVELASEPIEIPNLPEKGLKEGPFVFERNGIYYLTFPHVENNTERLEYAMGKSPMGPFKMSGVIMDESPTGCWTNHHSIINYKEQWYLFYHHNDYSPGFDKNRSVRIDSLFFNTDGTIKKVTPTLRGVGLTSAKNKIQIDRYSNISKTGVSVEHHDTINTFAGWKTRLENQNVCVQYNAVDFGEKKLRSVKVRAISPEGSTIQIRLDKIDGEILSEVKIPKGESWGIVKAKLLKYQKGTHDLFIILQNNSPVEIDWVQFEK